MANLLPGCIALAKYLLATRVDGAMRRLVPYLEEATGLDVSPVCIWITVGLTRRWTLHVTVGVVDSRALVRFGFRYGAAGLALRHVGSCAMLQEAR